MDKHLFLTLSEYIAKLLLHVNCDGEKPKKPTEISWSAVYAFAKFQSLASGIYSAVEDEVCAEAPAELAAEWDKVRATDLAKHIKQSAEFSRITKRLTEEKVNFLPLKGFTYKSLWKNPAYRTMSDLDIYFHPDDMKRVGGILTSLGFVRTHACDVHINYEKKPFINVEAHRKFVENGPSYSFDLWSAKQENPYWYIMNHEQFLTFSVMHAHHHYTAGGCGMRVIFDLFLYTRKFAAEINEERLKSALDAEGLFDFYCLLLKLADYWFGGEPKEENEEILKAAYYIATGGTYGSHENSVSYGIEKKGKLGYVISRVFPPYKEMRLRYPVLRKLPVLLPFMYVVRFVTSIFNGQNANELRGIKKHKENNKKNN